MKREITIRQEFINEKKDDTKSIFNKLEAVKTEILVDGVAVMEVKMSADRYRSSTLNKHLHYLLHGLAEIKGDE